MTHLAIQQGLEYTLTNQHQGGIIYLGDSSFTCTIQNLSTSRTYTMSPPTTVANNAWHFQLSFSHNLFASLELSRVSSQTWRRIQQDDDDTSIINLQYHSSDPSPIAPGESIAITFDYATLPAGLESGTDFTCAINANNILDEKSREIGQFLGQNIRSRVQTETPLHVQLDVVGSRQILTDIEAENLSYHTKTVYVAVTDGSIEEFATLRQAMDHAEAGSEPVDVERLHLHHADVESANSKLPRTEVILPLSGKLTEAELTAHLTAQPDTMMIDVQNAEDEDASGENPPRLSDVFDVVTVEHHKSQKWRGNLHYLKRGDTRYVFNSPDALKTYQQHNPPNNLLWQACVCEDPCHCSQDGVQGVVYTLSAWLTVDKKPQYSVLYFANEAERTNFINAIEASVRQSTETGASQPHGDEIYWLNKLTTKTAGGQKQNWHPDWANVVNEKFFSLGTAYQLIHGDDSDDVRYFETIADRDRFLTDLEDFMVEPTILRLSNLTAVPIQMRLDLEVQKRLFEIRIDSGSGETALTSDVLSDAINIEAGHSLLAVERDQNAKGVWYVVYEDDNLNGDDPIVDEILITGSDDPNQGFLDFFLSHIATDSGSGLTNVYIKALSSLPQLDGQIFSTQLERVSVKVSGNANNGRMIYGNHLTLTSNSETDGTFVIDKSDVIIRSDSEFEKMPFTVEKNKAGQSAQFEGTVSVERGITYQSEPGDLVPLGTIIMWSMAAGFPIPQGWVLCDGVQYKHFEGHIVKVPDLRDRFVRAANNYMVSDDDVTDVQFGGHNTVALAEKNLPAHDHPATGESAKDGGHNHDIGRLTDDGNDGRGFDDAGSTGGHEQYTSTNGAHTHTLTIAVKKNSAHRAEAFDIVPEHITMAFLMKLGSGYAPVE